MGVPGAYRSKTAVSGPGGQVLFDRMLPHFRGTAAPAVEVGRGFGRIIGLPAIAPVHFIPDSRTTAVPLSLKRRRDRTLG